MEFLKKIFHMPQAARKPRGFVMLYAILLSTVILTIGLSILSIVIAQQTIAGTERDSQMAFYAADTALECVLYWDLVYDDFFKFAGGNVLCNNQKIDVSWNTPTPPTTWTYNMEIRLANGTCANVVLSKVVGADGKPTSDIIDSRGYNTTCPSAGVVPRRLERGLRVTY